jgi:hypothetical protein
MSDPTPDDLAPMTLAMSRKRTIVFLVIALAFVTVGFSILPSRPVLGWVDFVFFGLGVIIFALQLAVPSVLTLDAEGFQSRVLFQRKGLKRSWAECSEFRASPAGASRLVVYSTLHRDHATLRRVNLGIAGGDEGIQSGFGGLNAAQLAQLLNRYRDAKLAALGSAAT